MKNQIEKIKISQQEFNEMYEIEDIDEKITDDLEKIVHEKEKIEEKSLLTEEEQEYDDKFFENMNIDEEPSEGTDK